MNNPVIIDDVDLIEDIDIGLYLKIEDNKLQVKLP